MIFFGRSNRLARIEIRGRNRGCGRPIRSGRALLSLVFAIIWTSIAIPLAAIGAPYKPTDGAQPLERLPTAGNQNLRELRRLHEELSREPANLALALRVASQDIQAARSDSDPRYNGYAEAALGPWLSLPKPPGSVLLLRATLRQATHDFVGAKEDLDRVLSVDPRNVQARLTRATVLQVEGRYDEAGADCRSLALLAAPLVTTTCIAGINALHGRAKFGREVLQAAIDRAPEESVEVRLWALTLLGEMEARTGQVTLAEGHFRQALSLGLRDTYLMAAYSDFLLDNGRPAEVQSLLKDEIRVDPLLLRLALAEQQIGAPALSRHVTDLSERFSTSRLRGDLSHQREEARFTLHLLKRALEAMRLATANWAVQREPADTRLLLGAALSAGEPQGARSALDWLAASQLEDNRIQALASQLAALLR